MEVPPAAVRYVAEQVRVDPCELDAYVWSGRTIEYHRAQIRQAHGFREPGRGDESDLAGWLAAEVCPIELSRTANRAAGAYRSHRRRRGRRV